ncbi:MAG TPA: TonB-dependent receptor [Phenylobacterium sp.]|uniref:TonB-dependent receptor plug domain-containing protein n=1 Tax=Phenylobacterium sp. TaxID=1871053 RepID=UPI002B458D71|nr:TonB-dependent receptor [Phenylobacterium sp.]HKR89255.1 TonB-dependent receptor [Phenylobacterium sp.]
MNTRFFVSTAISVLAVAAPAASLAADMDIPSTDELVVVASRAPERADHIGQQVTVLTAEELKAQQTQVLSDILSRTPGVSFSRNGGVGAPTQVYIRGAETGQTVVLIDGVKLNDPTSTDNSFNFGNLLVGDISRVEVLRGPQSVLWGSQAIGGVVNLITTDPTKPFESDLMAEGGSNNWYLGRAGVGGKTDRVAWRATVGYLSTTGVSAFDQAKGGTESDGYKNIGASAKAKVAVTDQLSLDLRTIYSRGRNDFDGFPPPDFTFADDREYGVTEDLVGYVGANLGLLDGRFTNRLAFAYTQTRRKNYDPDQTLTDVTFGSLGRNRRFEYQGAFAITPAWKTVFGAETEHASMRSNSPSDFDPSPPSISRSADLTGVYANLTGDVLTNLTLSGGIRHDHHSDFGGHTVGQASAAWRLNDGNTILRASWGQGFKAPSLYQLGSEFGNPNLAPESSHSWDTGIEQRLFDNRVVLSAAYFDRRTKNQIDFFTCTSGSGDPLCIGAGGLPRFGYYANTARTKAHGVELNAEVDVTDALTVTANYTWTDARNDVEGSPNFDKRLARRPAREANAEATYRWPTKLETAIAVHYAGDRFDNTANTTVLKGYVLWDIRASYPINDTVEVYGRIENLFDRSYETIRNYGQLGRAAYAGVRATF